MTEPVKLINAYKLDKSLARITPTPAAAERNPLIKAIPQVVAIFRQRILDEPEEENAVIVVRCEDCRYRPTCELYALHHERDNYCRKGVKKGERLAETVSAPDGFEPGV